VATIDPTVPVIYLCSACGKRSYDRTGDRPIDYGWDTSCRTHAVLVYTSSITNPVHDEIVAEAVPQVVAEIFERWNVPVNMALEFPATLDLALKDIESLLTYISATRKNST
jgi:hypothetical protein